MRAVDYKFLYVHVIQVPDVTSTCEIFFNWRKINNATCLWYIVCRELKLYGLSIATVLQLTKYSDKMYKNYKLSDINCL